MKKRILLFIALFVSLATMAQTENLPLDTIEGKVVYVYQVQKSEGIYRISKNFGISQETLIQYNPQLATEGLKLGQKVYIPYVEKIDSAAYITHQLEPKETLYGLSRKYGVSISELQALNPQTTKRMEIGSTLLIKPKELKKIQPVPDDFKPMLHEKAVADTVLKTAETAAVVAAVEELLNEANELSANTPDTLRTYFSEVPLRLAFLLPLQVDATKRNASMDRFLDFYEGALIAVYEAQQNGQQFDIYTYDIRKEDIAIQHVLLKSELLNADAIIGPAYPAQVTHAGNFAKQNRIPLLVPFTSKTSGLETNPYMWQFNPTSALEAAAVADYLNGRKDNINLIVIDGKEAAAGGFAGTIEHLVDSSLSVKHATMTTVMRDTLAFLVDDTKENILLFAGDKYAAIQVMMPHITPLKNGRLISMIGHYSWEEESPELPMLYAGIFHASDAETSAAYQQLYDTYFGHKLAQTHPRYDLLGYDMTKWLIRTLQQRQLAQTEEEKQEIMKLKYEGLQSDIRFTQVGENGGMINSNLELLQTVKHNEDK